MPLAHMILRTPHLSLAASILLQSRSVTQPRYCRHNVPFPGAKHLSVCQSLNYVMGAMFFAGILFQRKMGSCSKNRNNIVLDSEHTLEKSRSPLFTPPRARSPENALPYLRSSAQQPLVKKGTCSTSCELDLEDDQEMSIADSERQPAPGVGTEREAAEAEDQESQEGQHDGSRGSKDYDDDEAFILGLGRPKGGGGMWKRAAAGTRRSVSQLCSMQLTVFSIDSSTLRILSLSHLVRSLAS